MKKFLLSLLLIGATANATLTPLIQSATALRGFNVSTNTPANNDCLTYVSGTSSWTPSPCGGGGGISYPLTAPDGSAAAPSYAFSTNPGVGVFYINADTSMNFSFGTTATWKFNGSGIFPIVGGLDIATQGNPIDDVFANRFQMPSGGQVIFRNATNSISLAAPAGLAVDLTNFLPPNYGTAGQFLQTNGAGVWSWASAGSGSFPLLAPDGTAGAPSFSFAASPTTGIFSSGGNELALTFGGTNTLVYGATGLFPVTGVTNQKLGDTTHPFAEIHGVQYLGADGSAAAPTHSFATAPGSGMWHGGAGTVILGANGNNVMAIAPNLVVATGVGVANGTTSTPWSIFYSEIINANGGSAGTPGFKFNGTTGLGMYTAASDTLSFATQGTERLRLLSGGGFLVGDDGIAFFGDAGTGLNHPNNGEFSFLSSGSVIVKVANDGLRLQNGVWLAGRNNANNATVNIARVSGSNRIEVGDGSHDVYTSAADVSVSTTGTQYLSSGAGINMNISGGTLLVQGDGIVPVAVSLGNADNTAHARMSFSGLTDISFPLPDNNGADDEVLTRTSGGGSTWKGAPQGTVCGWYDVGTTTLISSCKGSNPSASCPTGYTQKLTAIVDFCVAN